MDTHQVKIDNCRTGVLPTSFGPSTWAVCEGLAQLYPEKPNQQQMEQMNLNLNMIFQRMGCGACVIHIFARARQLSIPLGNKQALIIWLFDTHNDVNQRTGKPIFSYKVLQRFYKCMSIEEQQQRIRSNAWKMLHWMSINYPVVPNEDQMIKVQIYIDLVLDRCMQTCLDREQVNVKSRQGLVWFLFDIHNEERRHKNKREWSRDEFIVHYIDIPTKNNNDGQIQMIVEYVRQKDVIESDNELTMTDLKEDLSDLTFSLKVWFLFFVVYVLFRLCSK